MTNPVNVYITVDTEMWPVHGGGWPHEPLASSQSCDAEFIGYFFGQESGAQTGLPLQLEMLSRYGLSATFFVDPLFSFALGLEKLARVVTLIESRGQKVALHLHPEWLTDPRCRALPKFRGPMLSQYRDDDQRSLIRLGWERLREAGCNPVRAFRAGSWGADLGTLRILAEEGLTVDSSLNAAYSHSLPSLRSRQELHAPTLIDGLLEVPMTRFDDGVSSLGRPLSLVGVSAREMAFVLTEHQRMGERSVAMVLHSNEFTRTDRLWIQRTPTPMRLIIRRFERLCEFLSANRMNFQTRFIDEAEPALEQKTSGMRRSSKARTMERWAGQLISRWY